MEEDIKILNKLEKVFAELKKDDEEGHSSAYEIQWEDIRAIEHLIAKNKELEQNYINPSKARFTYFDNGKGTKVVIEGFIPKSKVKEKIEEKIEYLKQIIDNGANGVRFANSKEEEIERTERQKNISTMIDILQQILETLELLED